MFQAIHTYENIGSLADTKDHLNLAWTLDEREFLSFDLTSFISEQLKAEIDTDLGQIYHYPVKDPFSEEALYPAVSKFFSQNNWNCCITSGAGVISLIYAFAKLVALKKVCIIGETYPDFPFWIGEFKGNYVTLNSDQDPDQLMKQLELLDVSYVFFERPSLFGDRFSSLPDLLAFCEFCAQREINVIIDESNANYYPPEFSAVNITARVNNLIVLRGISKAYGLGGLRFSYSVASNELRAVIRKIIPPLLTSSLSLAICKKILELGDQTAVLREKIISHKEIIMNLSQNSMTENMVTASKYLPYLLFKDDEAFIKSQFINNKITGKKHAVFSGSEISFLYRISVPLTDERLEIFKRKLNINTSS